MNVQARDAAQEFGHRFGRRPTVSRAPGRVNLIGEHTDYNDGFVMPAALEFATLVAASPRPDRRLNVYSMIMDETRSFDLDAPAETGRHDWSDYVFGVAVMLERAGRRLQRRRSRRLHGRAAGRRPQLLGRARSELGACAAHRLGPALRPDRDRQDLPEGRERLCRHALRHHGPICLGLRRRRPCAPDRLPQPRIAQRPDRPEPEARRDANSTVRHRHAGGEYNARREACEEGVRLLKPALGPITALRDVTPEDLEANRNRLPDLIYRRCRHIVTENARVLEAERALIAGDFAACGKAMNASHASMRDDFEITCPEVDFLADLAQGAEGVYGSRMTGGGFGGCTVSLVEAAAVERVSQILIDGYRVGCGLDAEVFVCSPSDGARLVPL